MTIPQTELEKLYTSTVRHDNISLDILNWAEDTIMHHFESYVISGNLNINGSSSVRRTITLTVFFPQDTDISLISIHKKVRVTYLVNSYTFPFGVYLITNVNKQRNLNGISISLTLKDKMSLLNGDCGGVIPAAADLWRKEEELYNGQYEISYPTVSQIIREVVNHFGKENLSHIIIDDIDDRIKQVVRWCGNQPLYKQGTPNNYWFLTTDNPPLGSERINIEEDVGYVITDFKYPTELTVSPGETVTSVLDKIINMLGNFEYFYDVDGYFHFREIKNYLNNSFSLALLKDLDKDNYQITKTSSAYSWEFKDAQLIASYSNSPQYSNIKNDFIVWGERTTVGKETIPIRYHLAIDQKPTDMLGRTPAIDEDGELCLIAVRDIYNNWVAESVINGYEYYGDYTKLIHHFVRYGAEIVYILTATQEYAEDGVVVAYFDYDDYEWVLEEQNVIEVALLDEPIVDWRDGIYFQGLLENNDSSLENPYFAELMVEWPKIYDIVTKEFKCDKSKDDLEYKPITSFDYFLDFIEAPNISVTSIGRRSKIVNSKQINCVFENVLEDAAIISGTATEIIEQRQECLDMGIAYIQMRPKDFENLALGGASRSAFEEIQNLLYQHTRYAETIQLQTVPMYHLEPNTLISVFDNVTDIHGDYIINTISIPLSPGGLMSISAVRAEEKL